MDVAREGEGGDSIEDMVEAGAEEGGPMCLALVEAAAQEYIVGVDCP